VEDAVVAEFEQQLRGSRAGGSASGVRIETQAVFLFQIDYPDIEQSRRVQNSPLMDHPQHRGINIMLDQAYAQNMMRPSLYHKCSRGSHSSDTSSAYSGSDTMASNHSELDGDDIDFTGLVESIVDSDEEDDLGESMDVSRKNQNVDPLFY
jgi:hypothetical protein